MNIMKRGKDKKHFVVYVPSQNGYIMGTEITIFKEYASTFEDNNNKSQDALSFCLKAFGLKKNEIIKDYEDVVWE